jgi:hypothetical protein
MAMDKTALQAWAEAHSTGPVVSKPDRQLSLSSTLLRFPWQCAMPATIAA